MRFAPNQDWTSRGFILENVAKGFLQALASLTVYAVAIWAVLKFSGRLGFLGDAIDVKLPMLAHAESKNASAGSGSLM